MNVQNISTYKNIKQLGATAAAALAIIATTPKESNAQQIYTNMYGSWVKLEDYQALEKKIENYKSSIRVNEKFIAKYKEQLEPYPDSIEALNNQYQLMKVPYDQLKSENDAKRNNREIFFKDMNNAYNSYLKQQADVIDEKKIYEANHQKNWVNYLLFGFLGMGFSFLGKFFKHILSEDSDGVKCKSQK